MKRRLFTTLVLLCAVVALLWSGNRFSTERQTLIYCDSLDMVALEVDGKELTLRDMAYYVACEEKEVEKQACEYDPEDTSKYWNLHVDGLYIRVAARNAVIQKGIHDEIFYRMAMEDPIGLSSEEEQALSEECDDFWNDLLEEEQTEKLGITKEELYQSMRKMIFAEKYQDIYAQMEEKEYHAYDCNGEEYQNLLEQHTYKIREKVWKRVNMGNVILDHKVQTQKKEVEQ